VPRSPPRPRRDSKTGADRTLCRQDRLDFVSEVT
jgi:hypothetical protein